METKVTTIKPDYRQGQGFNFLLVTKQFPFCSLFKQFKGESNENFSFAT